MPLYIIYSLTIRITYAHFEHFLNVKINHKLCPLMQFCVFNLSNTFIYQAIKILVARKFKKYLQNAFDKVLSHYLLYHRKVSINKSSNALFKSKVRNLILRTTMRTKKPSTFAF